MFSDKERRFTKEMGFWGSYGEGAGGEGLGAEGYSKDFRPDLKQMVLAVTLRDARMLRHAVADVTPPTQAVEPITTLRRSTLITRQTSRTNSVCTASITIA